MDRSAFRRNGGTLDGDDRRGPGDETAKCVRPEVCSPEEENRDRESCQERLGRALGRTGRALARHKHGHIGNWIMDEPTGGVFHVPQTTAQNAYTQEMKSRAAPREWYFTT